MTSVLVPLLLYLRPTPFPVSVSVCLPPPPHPHTLPGKYILSPTLHCHHGNLWPLTSLCCCSSVLVSLFSLFSVFLSLPVSLSLSLSLCFVWLVMSGLSNYVSIFNVVLIVFFLFCFILICSFFWCFFSSYLGLFTACVYKTWHAMTISKTKYYFIISYGSQTCICIWVWPAVR